MYAKGVYGKGSEQAQRGQEKETDCDSRMIVPFMTLDEIREKLQKLEDDPTMQTRDAYTPNAVAWPDGRMPFAEVHLNYLRTHKHVNPAQYISNLELMIKKR